MAKVLKTAAIVVGVAALAVVTGGAAAGLGISLATSVAGISASTLLLASGGLSLAAGLLTKKPTIPSSQTSRLTASIDPGAFRKTVLGQTAMATDVRYEEWSGDNQDYCDWIVAVASHAIDGVEEIWLNTDLAWSATTGVAAKYTGYFWVPNIVLEGTPANAFSFGSGKWSASSARLTGCAYVRLRFKVTGNGKKSDSPFSGGPPSRMTIIGRGAKLYDPRRDDTVPGGSGPMRWDDQSTWRYTTDDGVTIGENLPLQILYRVLGWRIRNPNTGEFKLAVGNGVPGRRIGMESFQVAANLADELVNRSAGGQEPRYHGAGVVSEGDDNKTVLDALCAGCCGRFRDTGGKLELVIAHNDLATAATDDGLNDDDVIGPFTWDPDPSLDETPNVVRGKYVDATAASLYQPLDYPEVRLPSPDGQDRFFSLDLGYVESPSQVQRIGKQVLERKQYQRRFTAPFDIRAWKYPVGAVVPFTFAALSFNRKLFRVEEQELGQNGTCNMTLLVESDQIYAWDADDTPPVQPADAIVYDARNNPLILAIDEASTTANWSAVVDDDGTKPENNATVGAPPGTTIGGRTVEEVLGDIDTAKTDISELFDTYGDTASAASSANAADQAMHDAQAARDAASTAQSAAEANAQTASQSATDAAGSATTASGQATIATQKADAASQAATIASAAADTASTKAGEASVSASHAATSESNALGSSNSAAASSTVSATNADAAKLATAAAFPRDFAAGIQFWGNLNGSPQAQAQPANWSRVDTANGAVLRVTDPTQYEHARTRNLISSSLVGRTFRVTAKLRLAKPATNGAAVRATANLYGLGADYSTIYYSGYADQVGSTPGNAASLVLPPDGSVQTVVVQGRVIAAPNCPWIAPSVYLFTADSSSMAGAQVDYLSYVVEDITESDAASDSADAAATSASAAATAATNAGTSASSASTSANTASTKAADAATSASAAATSASSAQSSSTSAGQSASAANQSKLDAQAANTSATTQAGIAQQQATIATNKAAEASSSSSTAASYSRTAALSDGNQYFDAGVDGWADSPTAADAMQPATGMNYVPSYSGASNCLTFGAARANIYSFKKFPITAGRKYRVASRFGISVAAGSSVAMYTGIQTYAGSATVGSNTGHRYYGATGSGYAAGWTNVSGVFNADDLPAGTTSVRLVAFGNYGSTAGGSGAIDYLTLEDITESDSATTQATIATNQAAIATAEAAAAQTSSVVAAQAGSGDSNLNSMFANWASATSFPANWGPSSNVTAGGNLSRATGITSSYAARIAAAAAQQTYMSQAGSNAPWTVNVGTWVVLEADIILNSGSLTGAGMLMRVNGSGDITLNFGTDKDTSDAVVGAGVAGKSYSFRKLVQVVAGSNTASQFFCMNHWSVLGSIAAANDITWYRCGWRPATAAEIKTGQIDTLNATVSQQAGAIANLQTKTATAYVETTASVPGAEATVEIVATTSNGSPASAIALKADAVVLGDQRALEVVGTEVRINGSMVNAAADGSKTTSNGWGLRQDDPSGNWVIGIGNLTKLGVA